MGKRSIAILLMTGLLMFVSACGMQRYIDEQRNYELQQERLALERRFSSPDLYDDHFYDRQDRNHGQARYRKSRRRARYTVGKYEVFYDGRPVKDASASTFDVLGDGYAKDRWTVYFEGIPVKDASAPSFRVLKDGYAADAWNVYYDGRRIVGASPGGFKVLRDGYAKDNWSVYYAGMMVKDAHPGSFKVLRDGYGKDAWGTFLHGRKIGH